MARVLLINDEPDLVEMCEIVLEAAGHEVFHSIGPRRAAELAAGAAFRPDVILLDLVMPGMQGDEVFRAVRRLRNTAHVPVVLMSAVPNADERAEALGAVAVLEKPFDPDALVEAINKALAHARDERSRLRNSFRNVRARSSR